MAKSIYELKLHETTFFTTEVKGNSGKTVSFQYVVTRVPKGWFYILTEDTKVKFFVPYDEEFKEFETQDLGGVSYED